MMIEVLGMADETVKLIALTCEETGRIGGLTRARKLTAEQRRESARRAAQARWQKKAAAPDPTDPKGPNRDDEGQGRSIMLSGRRKPAIPVSVTSQPGSLRAAA